MGTALDALTAPQPLTARRPAASTLPSFELPPPSNFQIASASQKYSSPTSINPVTNVSVGNLLTPPSNHSEAAAPLSSGTSSNAVSAAQEQSPYPSAYWHTQNPYAYGSGPATHQPWNQGVSGLFPPPRGGYSPSLGPLGRSTNQPPVTEGMSQSYDLNQLPPFQQSLPVSSPTTPSSAVQQQQQQQQQQAMAHAMMSAQSIPTTSAASPHQMSTDPYGSKPHSTPLFATPQHAAPPHQGNFPTAYAGPSPVTPQSGLGIHAPGPRIPSAGQSPPMQPPQLGYNRTPWPSYSLPAMSGPVITNVHNPGGQMSLMGNLQQGFLPGFNSGQVAAGMQTLYGGHPPHQTHGQSSPPNDRPFKCDQCPQSFNRNHDLKRHKRIHLSVKPFPCNHCEKSFSRKDALKVRMPESVVLIDHLVSFMFSDTLYFTTQRHILVKGCGNKDTSSDNGTTTQATGASAGSKEEDTLTKVESHSDKASPLSNGHE
ncbi:hypothetical protein Egran_01039 [Elaphomyces granulatus]|uniref:C2H2-type domain-containing protein n=1 Tax=Elaphomyces granulatus TaxID=519963 RepID=A0A232M445_9EURO|nr:hypothetical protein Egran_01039 [Elaphomyces granulatus]